MHFRKYLKTFKQDHVKVLFSNVSKFDSTELVDLQSKTTNQTAPHQSTAFKIAFQRMVMNTALFDLQTKKLEQRRTTKQIARFH